MLKRIPSILSPELLHLIAQMGHGDELVIADANFPAVTNARRLVRADGHSVPAILEGILQLFPLDSFVEKPAAVMRRVDKPGEPAPVWAEFQRLLDSAEGRHIADRAGRAVRLLRARQAGLRRRRHRRVGPLRQPDHQERRDRAVVTSTRARSAEPWSPGSKWRC